MEEDNIIIVKNLCKSFNGQLVLDNINLNIPRHKTTVLIGRSGDGKSVFLKHLIGLLKPDRGQVLLGGENITAMRSDLIARKGLARTFQNIKLFKYMTVLENVTIGFHINTKTTLIDAVLKNKRYRDDEEFVVKRGLAILEQVGLFDYKDIPAGNLAYGIQRKVEIARALATDPKILLLDEPAAGMNPNETQGLMEFIKNLNAQGYTIAVIEHDMKFVMNSCNHVLVLNFGEKICEGSPDEVKADKAVQEAYFGKGFIAGGAVYA
jgi:branched-chain amino acid transport system ATP-binding protein